MRFFVAIPWWLALLFFPVWLTGMMIYAFIWIIVAIIKAINSADKKNYRRPATYNPKPPYPYRPRPQGWHREGAEILSDDRIWIYRHNRWELNL